MQSYGATDSRRAPSAAAAGPSYGYATPYGGQPYPASSAVPSSSYQGGYPPGQAPYGATAAAAPDDFQLPDDVTVDILPMADADNAVPAMPSAPPVGIVQGYVNVAFDETPLAPPKYDEVEGRSEPAIRPSMNQVPTLSEAEARSALVEHSGQECCYGNDAAKDMVILSMNSSSAYHYILDTFGESRSTKWAFSPYKGEPIDGPMNGPAPGPWDIALYAKEKYKDSKISMEVPRTANIQKCHKCVGLGRLRCHHCNGHCSKQCFSCNGTGHRRIGQDCQQCPFCHGSGHDRCSWCCGHGHIRCGVCHGASQLKWYIRLTVTWKNHVDDYILERSMMPKEKIREVQGDTVFDEELPWLFPVSNCPEPTVNHAAADLVANHRKYFNTERILLQRQRLRIVPLTEVNASWKNKTFSFIVHGLDRRVHTDSYPQDCCCGCTIV